MTTDLTQFPLALWPLGMPTAAPPTFQLQTTTGGSSSSATPSPTPSNSSTDSPGVVTGERESDMYTLVVTLQYTSCYTISILVVTLSVY